jgi:hypothetical protein
MVVGWLVGVFFGLRWLGRKAVALGRELTVLADAAEKLAAVAASQPAPPPLPPVAVGGDGTEPAARVEEQREAREARREKRRQAHAKRYAEWDILAGRAG